MTNIEIAKLIIKFLKKPESLINFIQDRPCHDFRYSLNWNQIRKMGWKPQIRPEDGLKSTTDCYVANEKWWAGLV